MKKAILWFRKDLRLSDNPALNEAARKHQLLPIYIKSNPDRSNIYQTPGEASSFWLQQSLINLNEQMDHRIHVIDGDPDKIITALCLQYQIQYVFCNRTYEPWQDNFDKQLETDLAKKNIAFKQFENSRLLNKELIPKTKQGNHYKVFTPFYKNYLSSLDHHFQPPVSQPKNINWLTIKIDNLTQANYQPWQKKLLSHWQIGEKAAQNHWLDFLENNLQSYHLSRDYPAKENTSKIAPYLHWGEISAKQLYADLQTVPNSEGKEQFIRSLIWREFNLNLLNDFNCFHFQNWQKKFDHFPWQADRELFNLWKQGKTGYPMVDAGMRELWQTGFMHNRVRMITASFLVKNLLIDWRLGQAWFWNCLLDADIANNSANWQWVAGCGADAAPFFRIFNPVTQAEKFDPTGDYIRNYLPEIAKLPTKYLFKPWQAPKEILEQADIQLGVNYPRPIVDLSLSRQNALNAYQQLSK